jgi:hypothetical protein
VRTPIIFSLLFAVLLSGHKIMCHVVSEASWVGVFFCSGFSVSFQLLWNLSPCAD